MCYHLIFYFQRINCIIFSLESSLWYTTDGYSSSVSNDVSDNADNSSASAWALAVLERVTALEQHAAQRSEPSSTRHRFDDPFISGRSPDTDFSPYPAFRDALPGFAKDFLRNPLPEAERQRFLSECRRNLEREYNLQHSIMSTLAWQPRRQTINLP